MYRALSLFQSNIQEARNLTILYGYLKNTIVSPLYFDDLLRAQIVYSVSAFDKLIHDIVRLGMLEIFMEKRPTTPKYLAESISMITYNELVTATIPPPEYIFEQAIFQKLKTIAYQDPQKVAEGLSYIWEEKGKWQKIATRMGMEESFVKTRLKLIVNRRNIIVHEADIDPLTNQKYDLDKDESEAIVTFLFHCGNAIFELVSLES